MDSAGQAACSRVVSFMQVSIAGRLWPDRRWSDSALASMVDTANYGSGPQALVLVEWRVCGARQRGDTSIVDLLTGELGYVYIDQTRGHWGFDATPRVASGVVPPSPARLSLVDHRHLA